MACANHGVNRLNTLEKLTTALVLITGYYAFQTYILARLTKTSVHLAQAKFHAEAQPMLAISPEVEVLINGGLDSDDSEIVALNFLLWACGAFPALEVRTTLQVSSPENVSENPLSERFARFVQTDAMVQGGTFVPDSTVQTFKIQYVLNRSVVFSELDGPMTGVLALTYRDIAGGAWASTWAFSCAAKSSQGNVRLVSTTNPYL